MGSWIHRQTSVGLFLILVFIVSSSCLEPRDPSAVTEDEKLIMDSERAGDFRPPAKPVIDTEKSASSAPMQGVQAEVYSNASPEGGYGYKILIDGKVYINQASIPALSGNKGFSSPEKARKAANFVIYKIKNNILPPSVNRTELDSLGVLD